MIPNWKAHYKNKDQAKLAILELLMNSPSVADSEGHLLIGGLFGWNMLTPRKRKVKE